jgi:hypothetical protein
MRALLFETNKCQIFRGDTVLESNIKPDFSFEYNSLMFDFLIDMGKMIVENEIVQLTDAQKEEVNTYIDTVEADAEAQLNLDSREYLVNTDWYITRKAEIGTAIPMDILAKRAEARAAITLGPR